MIDTYGRRAFVTTALATGFALAVRPVAADTITTDANGLTAGEVKIPAGGGEMPAYRAMPNNAEARAPFPVILVVHEIFGVHEHIKDVCRRLAKLGYMAIAPELYAREGDVSKIASISEVIAKVVSKVPDAQVMSDLDATVAWAKLNKGDGSKLSVTGFCWGGRVVWLYAAHNPALKAGVAWYGGLSGAPNTLRPHHPLDLAAKLKAPVLGLYGAADMGIPIPHIEQMRAELAAAKNPSEIVVYPDTPHGFNADYRPSFRKEAADDAWKRVAAFLKKNGAGASRDHVTVY